MADFADSLSMGIRSWEWLRRVRKFNDAQSLGAYCSRPLALFFFFSGIRIYIPRAYNKGTEADVSLRSAIMNVDFWKGASVSWLWAVCGCRYRWSWYKNKWCRNLFKSARLPALPRFNAGPGLLNEESNNLNGARRGAYSIVL